MSRKGGYKIIDLQGYDFSSSMVIKGLHERIESSYDKPLLFTGIVIDGVEKNDVLTTAVVNGDGYDVWFYNLPYHINNNDVIELKTGKIYQESIQDIYLSDGLSTLVMSASKVVDVNIHYKGVIIPIINSQNISKEDMDITYEDSFIKLIFDGQGEDEVYILAKNGVAYVYTF